MMKTINLSICIIVCMLMITLPTYADNLNDRVEQLEHENAKLKDVVRTLLERIDALENKHQNKSDERDAVQVTSEDLEDRVASLEEHLNEGLLPSIKGKKFRVGGEIEIEYRDTENENDHSALTTDKPDGQFQIDKFELDIEADISENITLNAQVQGDPDGLDLDKAFIQFSGLPLSSYLKAGLDNRFIKPGRKTESYPLAGTAFWRDEDIGLELGGESGQFYYRLSVSNGLQLKKKEIGEDNSDDEIIQDDDSNMDLNNNKEIGAGAGYKIKFMKDHKIDVLLFYYYSELSDDDISYLKSNLSGYSSNKDDNTLFGINMKHKFMGWTFFAQYIKAVDGDLEREGWYIQPSYKHKIAGLRYLRAMEFLYRYEMLDTDRSHDVSNPLTWDRKRYTMALITEIVKNLKLKIEYNINKEDTGGADLDNDEFIGQLEVKF